LSDQLDASKNFLNLTMRFLSCCGNFFNVCMGGSHISKPTSNFTTTITGSKMMDLRALAELPADTFAEGPVSGQYESDGSLRPEPR